MKWRWGNRELVRFLRESCPSVLFSAALVMIIEHLGWLTVLSRLSLLIVSNSAAMQASLGPHDFSRGPFVFAIDETDFQGRFRERSPLDHCLVAGDLARLYGHAPAAIGVDLDLSPPAGATGSELACQKRLDALLDAHAAQTTLIVPQPVASPVLRTQKLVWMQRRCEAGVRFASPYLERSLGVVIDQREHVDDSLAAVVVHPRANPVCEALAGMPAQVEAQWLDSASAGRLHDDRGGERRPINFALAAQRIRQVIPIASNARDWPALAGATVFFGGSYGQDDNYITPIGKATPGVWIHAARMVTLAHPIEALPGGVALLVDIVSGFAFALLIRRFWMLFARTRSCEPERRLPGGIKVRSAWSSLVLVGFLLAYVLLCLVFFVIARYLFFHEGLIIAPLLMALSMLLDGFITGPVEVLSDELVLARRPGNHDVSWRATVRSTSLSILAVLVAWAGFLALWRLAAEPGPWLLVALALLLAGTALRPGRAREPEEHELPRGGDAPAGVLDWVLLRIGWVCGGARIFIFAGVVGYASWIVVH